jgi:hypothetical protein
MLSLCKPEQLYQVLPHIAQFSQPLTSCADISSAGDRARSGRWDRIRPEYCRCLALFSQTSSNGHVGRRVRLLIRLRDPSHHAQ